MVTGSGPTYTHEFFRTNHQGSVIATSADDGSPGQASWYPGSPGVSVNKQGYAVIPIFVTKNNQVPLP